MGYMSKLQKTVTNLLETTRVREEGVVSPPITRQRPLTAFAQKFPENPAKRTKMTTNTSYFYKGCRLVLKEEGDELLIGGQTFPVKDELKALGSTWSSEAKSWIFPLPMKSRILQHFGANVRSGKKTCELCKMSFEPARPHYYMCEECFPHSDYLENLYGPKVWSLSWFISLPPFLPIKITRTIFVSSKYK